MHELDKWVAGRACNSALVFPVSRHLDVTILTPRLSPTVTQTVHLEPHIYNITPTMFTILYRDMSMIHNLNRHSSMIRMPDICVEGQSSIPDPTMHMSVLIRRAQAHSVSRWPGTEMVATASV